MYIFAGEDLPESDPLTDEQKKELLAEAKGMDASYIKTINEHIDLGKVNATNVKQYIVRIKQMKSEIKKKGEK